MHKNKVICYIETPLDHKDITIRDGNISNQNKLEFYQNLNKFFLKVLKLYGNKELFFCQHPSSKIAKYKNIFSSKIKFVNNTKKYILSSRVIIFHQSSAISTAIINKKKVIHLKSKLMGNFLSYRNELYLKHIKFFSLDVNEYKKFNKTIFENHHRTLVKQYNKFINLNLIDKNRTLWYEKVNLILNNYAK